MEKTLKGSSYFNQKYFSNDKTFMLNTIVSTTLALFDYFESFIFNLKSDPQAASRIIYAKNDYAFRARLQNLNIKEANSEFQINTLNMPFMNFGISSISLASQRLMSTYQLATKGVYVEELGKKLRLFPVTIDYEGCFFTTQTSDAQIVLAKMYKQAASETLLSPSLYYNGNEFKNFANVNYTDITYDGQYSESDYLEQNRIHTVAFSLSIDTYFVDTDYGIDADNEDYKNKDYALVKDLYFKFAARTHLDTWPENENDYDMMMHAVVDHINKEVIWK